MDIPTIKTELESQYFRLSGDGEEEFVDPLETNWSDIAPCITRRSEYRKYLGSKRWKTIAKQIRSRAKDSCEICGKQKKLYVHHRLYPETFGEETEDHLIALCNPCHLKLHAKKAWIYE